MWNVAQARAAEFSYPSFEKRSVLECVWDVFILSINVSIIRISSPNHLRPRFTRVITRGLLTRGFRFFIAESLHAVRVCSRSNLVRHPDRAEDLEGLVDGVLTPFPGQTAEPLYAGRHGGGHGLTRLGLSDLGGGNSIMDEPPIVAADEKRSNYAAVIVEGRNHYALE